MAMNILSVIMFGILLTGLGSDAALVTVIPDKCIATLQDAVHISCEPSTDSDDDRSNDVALIELSRNGEDPMVFLRDCSNITYGGDGSDRVQAEGKISKTPGQTYLNVTLRNPMSQDTGIYTCTVLYVDGNGKPKQTFSSSNLVVEKLDVTSLESVLTSFTNKISAIEEKHRTQVTSLEDKMAIMEKDHLTNMTSLHEKIVSMEENHEKHMIDLNNSDYVIMNNLTVFREDTSKQINELIDKVSYTVAFSATNTKNIVTTNQQTLIFDGLIMEIGHGYDVKTGIFTAPRRGIYVFHLVVGEYHHCGLNLGLKVNGNIVASLFAYDKTTWGQSSVSTVANLIPGDEVWFVPEDSGCKLLISKYSVFTGYLIRAL